MLRPALSILIGALLAFLLAAAAQVLFLPFLNKRNASALTAISTVASVIVFCAILTYFVVIVLRGRHTAGRQ